MQNATRKPVVAGAGGFYLSLAEFCHTKLYLEEALSFAKLTNGFNPSRGGSFPTSLVIYVFEPLSRVNLLMTLIY